MKLTIGRKMLLCPFSLCQTFETKSDESGCWGECSICGKRVGFVSRAKLRTFADAEAARRTALNKAGTP